MPSLISDPVAPARSFEFHATLHRVDDGLDTLHRSVQLVRECLGREEGDYALMLFETALAEVGANVLRYAHPERSPEPLAEYELRLEAGTLTALLTDWGPPLHNHLTRAMPAPTDETGRGLAIARKVLDELDYERKGEVNTWRLVKRL